ncbi:MAG: YigZ family protein [Bacteroidales bacterium]|jgi:uncharacterized YigZ family protein|nr:YigZ family protein [Bacteroidales bacterium]
MSSENTDTYKTISTSSEGLYKEKGSKFLAFAFPVNSKEEVEANIAILRKKYFDARHHCYAWRLATTPETFRANDDGEPSGTAGKPIYGQIISHEVTNILIVVVRYFGGVLLGTGGLVKAYKTAAAEALNNATIIEKIRTVSHTIKFPYEKTSAVMKILKDKNITPSSPKYNEAGICEMEIEIRLRDVDRIKTKIAEIYPDFVTKTSKTVS